MIEDFDSINVKNTICNLKMKSHYNCVKKNMRDIFQIVNMASTNLFLRCL